MSPTAQQTRQGQNLQQMFRDAGGDPDVFAAQMSVASAQLPAGAQPTVAQALGDTAFNAIEEQFKQVDAAFGKSAAIQARQTIDAVANQIIKFREVGDAGLLVAAGRAQDAAYREIINFELQQAKEKAVATVDAFTDGLGNVSKLDFSRAATEIYSESLKSSRAIEHQFYQEIPDVVPSSLNPILEQHTTIRKEMLAAARLPSIVEDTIASYRATQKLVDKAVAAGIDLTQLSTPAAEAFLKKNKTTAKAVGEQLERFTTGELQIFRSKLLELSRKANKKGNAILSRHLGQLAEATRETFNVSLNSALELGTIDQAGAQAWSRATAFTAALTREYISTFGGVTRLKGRRGELQVQPEELLPSALAGGEATRALRMEDISNSVGFLVQQADAGVPISEEALASAVESSELMFETQQGFLRLMAAEVVDKNGRANTTKIFTELKKNKEILKNFPVVKKLLEDARTSEDALQMLEQASQISLRDDQIAQNAFAQVAKFESGSDAIKFAFRHDRPIETFEGLVEVARRGSNKIPPKKALEGLRRSIWDFVIDQSQRDDSLAVSLPKLVNMIREPIKPGLPSLLDIMADQKLMSTPEIETLNRLLAVADNVVASLATTSTGENVFDSGIEGLTGAGMSVLLRMTGSTLATSAARLAPIGGGNTGRSLIVAQSGARFMETIFRKLPKLGRENILRGALRGDPLVPGGPRYGLAIALMEAPTTPGAMLIWARQINAYAIYSLASTLPDQDIYNVHDDQRVNPNERGLRESSIRQEVERDDEIQQSLYGRSAFGESQLRVPE